MTEPPPTAPDAELSARLAQALEEKRHTLAWDARAAGQRALEVLVLARLVQDLAG